MNRSVKTWLAPAVGFLFVLFFAWFAATSRWIGVAERQAIADASRLGEAEAIFVLAHYVSRGEALPVYHMRLEKAYELWESSPRPVWLLGAKVFDEAESNAVQAERILAAKGVPEDWILTYDDCPYLGESVDTITEVRSAAKVAAKTGVKKFAVVSDAVQLAQALAVFESLGIQPLLAATKPASKLESRWDNLKYHFIRRSALIISMIDPKGRTLFWVRWLRRENPGRKLPEFMRF